MLSCDTIEKKCLYFEGLARGRGFSDVAGVDEAGRGPLAGPVVAAACVLPQGLFVDGVDDSKSLSPSKRSKVFDRLISSTEIRYGVGIVDALEIDQINILQATFLAMKKAVLALGDFTGYILVDGSMLPAWQYPSEAIIKGDSLSHSIAAASIIAKEIRDRIMEKFEIEFPGYGFGKHKGYGTKAHLEAISKLGPSKIHRKSFEPIKSMLYP